MERAQPASLSVYRGQSRTGEGEGPGRPVQHGEQYLWVARDKLWNGELLDTIRPWMTLDSDPADHQRLEDRLESWSLFSTGELLFVVRLVSAGVYDRRAAYFAHGRAWEVNALPAGFDPGLFIGCSDAFDEPGGGANDYGRQIAPDVPLRWPEQVAAEQETAARFLGHLFQTRLDGSLLLIAAPVAAFESRGPLHGLIAFARAGLPAALRRTCRLRIYSRMPELFLRHPDANVLVVPEEAASAALSSRPNATLLDREGNRLAGKELDVRARDYAAAVVGRAIGIPQGLGHFSDRFAVNGLPSAEETRSIQIRYNVAFALAGDEDRKSKLLRDYLPRAAAKIGAGVDWNELIRPDEWDGLPGDALLDHILIDTRELSNGGRQFLRAVEEGALRRKLAIDDRLADWWDADDPAKLHRMLELLAQPRRLVSDGAAAERTIDIPLATLTEAGPVAGALRAEAESGLLAHRAHETSELARTADDRKVFDILTRAVFEGRFEPAWASLHVRDASPEKLIEAAETWLSDGRFWQSWGDVPAQLLDRLRALDVPPARLELLIAAQTALDPVHDPELWLRLADLLSRISKGSNALLPQLWRALPRLLADPSHRVLLEDVVFSEAWVCLRPRSLEREHLLELAEGFQKEESHARLHELLDERMRESPEAATKALVRTGWWFYWRRRSRITDREVLGKSAIAWLSSDVWTGGPGLEATLEAWNQVISDLPSKLSAEIMAALRIGGRGQHLWPWIPPFEDEQLGQLIARAQDLGALAELAEAVTADGAAPHVGVPMHEHVLQCSDFGKELPSEALGWLLRESSGRPSPLTIEQSTYLYRRAGNRPTLAFEARLRSVEHHLNVDIREALEAAGDPSLWSEERFLRKVAKWMIEHRIDDFAGDWINRHIAGKLTAPISAPRELVQELSARGWNRAALLLDPDLANRTYVAEADPDSDKVIQALLARSVNDLCWSQLLKRVNDFRAGDGEGQDQHPITVIARRILSLSPENKAELESHGWATYQDAAEKVKGLMSQSPYALPDLPVFYLAASMLGPGAIGRAAVQVVNAPATRGFRADAKWWRSLFRSIREFRRYGRSRSADDRELVALALIWSVLDDRDEQAAFIAARKLEAKQYPDWALVPELGKVFS